MPFGQEWFYYKLNSITTTLNDWEGGGGGGGGVGGRGGMIQECVFFLQIALLGILLFNM